MYVVEHPDATIEEIQAWLLAEREVKVSVGCLGNRLRFLGLTFTARLRTGSAGVAEAGRNWRASQAELNAERLVFIDETGASTNMPRRYGRFPRGERLLSSASWGHWKTTTFVAALCIGEVTAPCLLGGPMYGESFRAYVEQCLVPTLRQGSTS